ncbi:ribosomal protein S4E [Clostridium tetanomorphum]|nr:DUF4363 family protein [Clostridium tetanomorphum]KAJ49806.1 hypothetical protein CTM_21081 [Clostridium tetanomorphum DSM 665]NRS84754.1 ribosomal protein S4E [Clostridium tetanomorphum]NRZ97970.1 ribosomal protein S4E [Clostridium tetanomorphum]SQB91743.1 Uncharacterised protein [Clostridium tetanomorphum]
MVVIKSRNDMRFVVGVIWIISFVVMWNIFNVLLPKNEFKIQLNQIEESVSKKDWNQARKSMVQLKNIYNRNRIFIQANNATEILTTFNYTMGQLDVSIQHEQNAALEYIGGLKSSLNLVMRPFSGP